MMLGCTKIVACMKLFRNSLQSFIYMETWRLSIRIINICLESISIQWPTPLRGKTFQQRPQLYPYRYRKEKCFGNVLNLLKGNFRKLKFIDMHRVEEIPSLIVACCALHNFITMHENIDDTDIDVEIDQLGETFVYIIDIILFYM